MIRRTGDLKQLISIQKKSGGMSPGGYRLADEWPEVCRVRAKAEDASYREFYAAEAANVRSSVNYWIRYRSGIEPGMWVEDLSTPGVRSQILQVNAGEHARQYLLLRCATREGVSP